MVLKPRLGSWLHHLQLFCSNKQLLNPRDLSPFKWTDIYFWVIASVLLHDLSFWDPPGRSSPNVALLSPCLRERAHAPSQWLLELLPGHVHSHSVGQSETQAELPMEREVHSSCREAPRLLDSGQGCPYDSAAYRDGTKEIVDYNDLTRVLSPGLSFIFYKMRR